MRELYDIDISDSTISRITDKILPIVKEWQERPLEEVYAVVFIASSMIRIRTPMKQYAHTGASEIHIPMKRNLQDGMGDVVMLREE